MSLFPEQFSEARKSQLDAQLNFFSTFTGKAFESAEKLIALNFDASRASLETSSALVRQVLAAKDPRDLLALTGQGQSPFESVLAYGRQLFSIVAAPGVANAAETPATGTAALEAPVAAQAETAYQAPAALVQASLVPLAAEAEPEPEPAPIATPNPIAMAAGTPAAMPEPSAASFPVTSSSTPISVTSVKPVEAAPPHAPVSGTPEIVSRTAAAPAAKQAKKK
jgi:phasin family protein